MSPITLTKLRRIPVAKGDVLHCLKAADECFHGFGEVYASIVHGDEIKGWKRHSRMVLNLVVVAGSVQFVAYSSDQPARILANVVLSPQSEATYQRLTVAPGVWLAFKGLGGGENIILNIASIGHDPAEADGLDVDAFNFVNRVD